MFAMNTAQKAISTAIRILALVVSSFSVLRFVDGFVTDEEPPDSDSEPAATGVASSGVRIGTLARGGLRLRVGLTATVPKAVASGSSGSG